jgi:hypothetical protein
MALRKTPILLRVGPVTGRVQALTRYSYKKVRGAEVLEAHTDGKYDVHDDFQEVLLEMLMPDSESDLMAALDGAAQGMDLNEAERTEIREFRGRMIKIIEAHNERADQRAENA